MMLPVLITNPVIDPTFGVVNTAACKLELFLTNLITAVMIVGSLAFFAYLIYGAIKWIISEGDKAKVQDARSHITHALTGLIILFSSFIIIGVIGQIFGINLTRLPIPSPTGAPANSGCVTLVP